jgi:hypothetical protein
MIEILFDILPDKLEVPGYKKSSEIDALGRLMLFLGHDFPSGEGTAPPLKTTVELGKEALKQG